MNKACKNVFTRFLSAMLAVIMVFSLLPTGLLTVTAEAADGTPGTIKPAGDINMISNYNSPNGLGKPYVHVFEMNAGSLGNVHGFCLNHSAHMGSAVKNETWKLKGTITPGRAASAFLSCYYDQWTNNEAGNAWAQAALWLDKAGKLSGSDDKIAEILAKERPAVCAGLAGFDASAPGNQYEASKSLAKQILQAYDEGKYGNWTFYEYTYAGSYKYPDGKGVQSLLIAVPGSITGNEFYLTLDKHDPDGNPMAGKTFRIYTDAACTTLLPGKTILLL